MNNALRQLREKLNAPKVEKFMKHTTIEAQTMKYLIFLFMMLSQAAISGTVSWTPADQREDNSPYLPAEMGGYRILLSDTAGGPYTSYTRILDSNITSYVIDLPTDKYIVMKSVDSNGIESSGYSNEAFIAATVSPPLPPSLIPSPINDLACANNNGLSVYYCSWTWPTTYENGDPLPVDAGVKGYIFINNEWQNPDVSLASTGRVLSLSPGDYLIDMEFEINDGSGNVVSKRSNMIAITVAAPPMAPVILPVQ